MSSSNPSGSSDSSESLEVSAQHAQLHFLLRRLHSLSGVMPVGVFVIFHLFTNAQLAWAAAGFEDKFQHEVNFIHKLPALLFLEIFGLWLPIAFHAGLGFWYTFTGKANVKRYSNWDNWRYLLQRITGILALIFILFHIATLRWRWDLGLHTPFFVDASHGGVTAVVTESGEALPMATASTAMALQASILVLLLYIIGVASVVFHWSNGLWTSAITWGITTSEAAQNRFAWVCGGLFVALATFSTFAIGGALLYEPTEAEEAAMAILKGDMEHNGAPLVADPDGMIIPGVRGTPVSH